MPVNVTLSYEEVQDLILGATYLQRRFRQAAALQAYCDERAFLLWQADRFDAAVKRLIEASENALGESTNSFG